MKKGTTKKALVRGDIRVPGTATCFRHLVGRSAPGAPSTCSASNHRETRRIRDRHFECRKAWGPQNAIGYAPAKLENCPPSPGLGERTRLACCRRRLAVGIVPTVRPHCLVRKNGKTKFAARRRKPRHAGGVCSPVLQLRNLRSIPFSSLPFRLFSHFH